MQQSTQSSTFSADVNRAMLPNSAFNALTDEREHALAGKDVRWSEVQKYINFISGFTSERFNSDLSSSQYHDLYNATVGLLKAVDSLNPNKLKVNSELDATTVPQSEEELLQARKELELYLTSRQNQTPYIIPREMKIDTTKPPAKKIRKAPRRKSSNTQDLVCLMCGVTDTPEWRRGPAGDHTLCNACGLHYAKSLKKNRKDAAKNDKNDGS